MERAEKNGVELVLPTDVVINPVFPKSDEDIAPEVVAADAIPADKMGLDIGPESQKLFHDKIVDSKTVVWNGPMGVFEVPEFAAGTKAAITPMDWAAMVLICFVLPAVLSVLFCEIERKLGWIKDGDLKLN